MKAVNGRLSELSRIAVHGCSIEYADTAFVSPNRWISSAIIHDFETRGLIQRSGTQATVTEKGLRLLKESATAKRVAAG